MTELWLIRHGQTDWNAAWRIQGQTDIPLNTAGLAQARDLAASLAQAGLPFAAIYSSDLSRASRTAEHLAETLGLPVTLQPDLREINQGEFEGLTLSEARERYPVVMAMRKTDPLDAPAPGGETTRAVALRMARAADAIAQAHPGQKVLVVSHGFAVATLICQAHGYGLSNVYPHIPDNAQPQVVHWPVTPPE
jgi:broad specificity phosphatase PhoE